MLRFLNSKYRFMTAEAFEFAKRTAPELGLSTPQVYHERVNAHIAMIRAIESGSMKELKEVNHGQY